MDATERHQIIVGGVSLITNGRVVTIVQPTCIYDHLSPANIQEFWNWTETNEAFLKASAGYAYAVGQALVEWGRNRGIETTPLKETK